MKDHLSRNEIRKDAIQDTVQAAAGTVGQVASILSGAVKEVAGALGGFATEMFEIRDSVRKATGDNAAAAVADLPDQVVEEPVEPSEGGAPGLGG